MTSEEWVSPAVADTLALGPLRLSDPTLAVRFGISRVCQELTLPNRTNYADLACSFTVTGSAKENVEPSATRDSTQIFPPCISIMRLEMASPSPVPPFLRVIELSAC